jgi:NAD(P)-dependent dehydrogenase (short-subunit alcohol dehydrogenase family)
MLVTGATSGMGKVTALRLAEQGAAVVTVGRNTEKTHATTQEIQRQTPNTDFGILAADLSSLAQVRTLAQRYLRAYPQLDVLINNAGDMCMHALRKVHLPKGLVVPLAAGNPTEFGTGEDSRVGRVSALAQLRVAKHALLSCWSMGACRPRHKYKGSTRWGLNPLRWRGSLSVPQHPSSAVGVHSRSLMPNSSILELIKYRS